MTDANLMDAECVHGIIWWDCSECEVMPNVFEREETKMNQMELDLRLEQLEVRGFDRSYQQGFAQGWREQHHRIDGMERREITFRSEIDARDDFIQRLMKELSQHGWGDFHYGPQDQDRNIVALLEEGGFRYEIDLPRSTPLGYIVRRKNDGVEYGPFKTLAEANVWVSEHNELVTVYLEEEGAPTNDNTRTDASPIGSSGEPGQRENTVGWGGPWEVEDSPSVLPEEGSTG